MTPFDFHEEMKKIVEEDKTSGDHEKTHSEADSLMEKALVEAGYGAGCQLLEKLTRWCA